MANRATPQRSTRSTSAPRDWLPLVRHGPMPSKTHWRDIQIQSRHNWFMAFCSAMGDTVQSRMVAKFYQFLRDFAPDGLTGRFSHISGREVMAYLLSHGDQTTKSRHRVTRSVDMALKDVENWIGKEISWQGALATAMAIPEAERVKLGRKRPAHLHNKAAGLRSPAEILAALIISHPDPELRLRNWIGRLQVDWMLQPRGAIDVTHGFWKGLNSDNLGEVFAVESVDPPTGVEMSADYDSLFGEKFADCERDIRPFVSEHWARRLNELRGNIPTHVDLDLSDEDGGETGDEAGDKSGDRARVAATVPSSSATPAQVQDDVRDLGTDQAEEARRLRARLNERSREPTDLEDWLVKRMDQQGRDSVLDAWCLYWEERIDEVEDLQGQTIIRSLFLQSLNKVRNLQAASEDQAIAWMVLDMADLETPPDESGDRASSRSHIPMFAACRDAARRLVSQFKRTSPSKASQNLMDKIILQQDAFFGTFMQHSPFHKHWASVLAFAALYMQVVSQGVADPVMSKEQVSSLVAERDLVLGEGTIDALGLRNWQIQALLLPGSVLDILTDRQHSVLQRRLHAETTNGGRGIDPSDLKPMPVTRGSMYPETIEADHGSLYKLFGTVSHPSLEPGPGPVVIPPSTPDLGLTTLLHVSHPGASTTAPNPPGANAGSKIASGCNTATTSIRRSRYEGKTFNATKRAISPLGFGGSERASKLPRSELAATKDVPSESIEGLKAELKTEIAAGLKTELAAELRTELAAELRTELAAELRTELAAELRAELTAKLSTHLAEIQQNFPTHEVLMQTCQSEVTAAMESLRGHVQEKLANMPKDDENVRAVMRPVLQEMCDKHTSSLSTQRDELISTMGDIAREQSIKALKNIHITVQADNMPEVAQDLQHKTPLEAGRDGYISQCIATPSWTQSQQEYETQLIRAAWRYIHYLGAPFGGVGEDGEAWAVVVEEFPQLDEDHLEMALDHVHMQAYGRMFKDREDV